jgi:hypothetical protein
VRGAGALNLDRDELAKLGDEAWRLFDESRTAAPDVVVDPSMPILYFGDTSAYQEAQLKVVTVGLNPSLGEFPAESPWLRFPRAAHDGTRPSPAAYLESLDEYFRVAVYSWFERGFGPILRGLGATYADGAAIHTDIASPVATNPTWSGLKKRKALLPDGARLWRRLVDLLAPDVVVVSVARDHLRHFAPAEWSVFHQIERRDRFDVLRADASIGRRRVPVFFGRNVNVPFGSVSAVEKERIGALIRESLA